MRKTTAGAILLILIGGLGLLAWKLAMPLIFEQNQIGTSDASHSKGTIRIGGDNFLGYWFMTSPSMRKAASRDGIGIQFTDDGGAYADRLAKFSAGEYDCIVLPVNSYLTHGKAHQYPGVIVAGISESKGADGIVGYADRLPTKKINDLNDASLRIVYTSDSPSEFLIDLTIADFDLAQLRQDQNWRVEVGGSREVFKLAEKNQGDVFVLWEPDLSRAMRLPGMNYIWGSDKFSGYIVDVFVFNREFLKRKPDLAADFLKHYFRTISVYNNNRELMLDEMGRSTDLKSKEIEAIIEKIDWFDLNENCSDLFGITTRADRPAKDGMITTIIANTDVLMRTGKVTSDPLSGNPYLITNSTFIEQLFKSQGTAAVAAHRGLVDFDELSSTEWDRLGEVGVFRVEPITFQSWNNLLTQEGKDTVDRIASLLQHNYPNYRIIIRGHTGPGGDEAENKKLSLERAQSVLQYLKAVHSLQANRVHAKGVGSNIPPAQKPGESLRAFQYRQSRVEFIAVEGNSL